jgi:glyoxylase-like metal-dependent hydrolase (beta-lactamase superfamily II)
LTVYHLNCGTLHPRYPRGTESLLYCLLVETNDGLLLVDTGFGTRDYLAPTRFVRLFTWLLGMDRKQEETAIRKVEELGFAGTDVRHIVLTHLHCDHTGGLPDFPHCKIHVFATEYETAMDPRGLLARFYERDHWRHGPDWRLYDRSGAVDWFGFESIRIDEGISPEVRLVLLPGHTPGHCGVAIATEEGWILHAGDATYPFYQKGDPMSPHKPLPKYLMNPPRLLERMVTGSQTPRLQALLDQHGDTVTIICSNDLITYSVSIGRYVAS